MHQEFPELQKLLQLRGQAAPADEYFEEFLDEFHRRQREDLMRRSARSLLWERLGVWFRELGTARWVFVAGAGYAVLMVLLFAWPKPALGDEGLAPASQEVEIIREEDQLHLRPFDAKKSQGSAPVTPREF